MFHTPYAEVQVITQHRPAYNATLDLPSAVRTASLHKVRAKVAEVQRHINGFLPLIFGPDDVFECRTVGPGGGADSRFCTIDSARNLATVLNGAGKLTSHGIYVTPQLLAPRKLGVGKAAADFDFEGRRYLLVDIDPLRPAEHAKDSATDAEREAAGEVANAVRAFFTTHDWPAPLVIDSGNGRHLYYRLIKLQPGGPADSATDPIARLLKELANRFDTPHAKIDTGVYNPSRIMRLPGTKNRKGTATLDRPHRRCVEHDVPSDWNENRGGDIDAMIAAIDFDAITRADTSAAKVARDVTAPHSETPRSAVGCRYIVPPHEECVRRARAYVRSEKTPPAHGGTGGEGEKIMFGLARELVDGFLLDRDTALDLLHTEYNPKCSPPFEDWEFRRKLSEVAKTPSTNERGWKYRNDAANKGAGGAAKRGRKSATSDAGAGVPPGTLPADPPAAGVGDAQRVVIEVGPGVPECDVNARVVAALADHPDIYQKNNSLVRVILPPAAALTPAGPLIDAPSVPVLRHLISGRVTFVEQRQSRAGEVTSPVSPPDWCVKAVHGLKEWPGVRPLAAVIDYPVVTPAGRVVTTRGYDTETELYVSAAGLLPQTIDWKVTQCDARQSAAELLKLVEDVPFEMPHHPAAWLAAVLTPLAKFAFKGCTPLFLFDATTPGAGKGLLADLVSNVIRGRDFAAMGYTHDDDEFKKSAVAFALDGDQMVLFDNVTGKFGNSTLNMILTSGIIKGRALGQNSNPERPITAVLYATGNNVQLAGDMHRRVCNVRIAPKTDRPEERTGFKIPNLKEHVIDGQQTYLTHALKILTGYIQAGRPPQNLPPYGAYIGWTQLVRGAIVWVGLPDPIQPSDPSRVSVDPKLAAMGVVLGHWERLSPEGKPLTANQILDSVTPARLGSVYEDIRPAFDELLKDWKPRDLGYSFREYKGRPVGGRVLTSAGVLHKSARWTVTNTDGTPLDYAAGPAKPTATDLDGCVLDTSAAGEPPFGVEEEMI